MTVDHPVGHNTLRGIALKIVSVAVFVAMQTCIKAAGAARRRATSPQG